MEKNNGIQNVQELIARYNRELMSTYRQQQTDDRLDREYPMPDIERDRQALAAARPPMPPQRPTPPTPPQPQPPRPVPPTPTPPPTQRPTPTPPPPTEEPAPYIGYLQIYAFTGSTAEPIEGAQVFVSRENDGNPLLYASTVTDHSGLTPVIPLPSVDPMLSMDPQTAAEGTPYVAYDIQVSALGFVPLRFENVPIYGGNSVTQPAAMLPLIAGENPDLPRVFRSGGPTNL